MKYRTTLKKICPSCRMVTRDRRVFVLCENKRHKQKQYFRPIKARSFSTVASMCACPSEALVSLKD
jgi:large subunit ribosomal protein L36